MATWGELARELERLLRLRTFPIAYKRLEKAEELDEIPRVRRMDRFFTFCQLPTLVRTGGWTVGVKAGDDINPRCSRIHGLAAPTEETIEQEAADFATTWLATIEESRKHMALYPRIPPGEAIVLAPLAAEKFDPDVILVYGTPAQLMLLMNGLQWREYERFQFYFIGEGACADALAQCYVSGKPSLAIPCYGERRFGGVADEELVLGVPPGMMGRGVEGMQKLVAVGLRYPIPPYGAVCDPFPELSRAYPKLTEARRQRSAGRE